MNLVALELFDKITRWVGLSIFRFKRTLFLVFIGFFSIEFLAARMAFGAFDHSHKLWDEVLREYVVKGKVKYKDLKANRKNVDSYITQLNSVTEAEYQSWDTADHRKAFLINAYNAYTVRLILDHYPLTGGIKEIIPFWKRALRNVWNTEFDFIRLFSGKIKTLDPIEKEFLLKDPSLKEPRIHAVVNCASISCPELRAEAFLPQKLNEQLGDAFKVWLADSEKNRFIPKDNRVELSMIFSWYKDDFGDPTQFFEIIQKYGPEDALKLKMPGLKIDYIENYNWGLNEVK